MARRILPRTRSWSGQTAGSRDEIQVLSCFFNVCAHQANHFGCCYLYYLHVVHEKLGIKQDRFVLRFLEIPCYRSVHLSSDVPSRRQPSRIGVSSLHLVARRTHAGPTPSAKRASCSGKIEAPGLAHACCCLLLFITKTPVRQDAGGPVKID